MIGAEPEPVYNRPPLSKSLWKGEALDTIWRKPTDKKSICQRHRLATFLDPDKKEVRDVAGSIIRGKSYCWPPVVRPGSWQRTMITSSIFERWRIIGGFEL